MHNDTRETAIAVMRPGECRAWIGQAVASLSEVRARLTQGRMVIVGGTTTRHVVTALTGADPGRDAFAVGWIRDGLLGETPREGRGPGPFLFENGQVSRGWPAPLLERFEAGDIYIKGANAIDPAGNVAVLMASPTGGTIGAAMAILMARGGQLIIPVSLSKLIPSVATVCRLTGQGRTSRVMGTPVGYMPILAGSATVITEVEAVSILSQGLVKATPVARGGVDDCEGALVLALEGPGQAVERVMERMEEWRRDLAEGSGDPA
ncbi:hypothetical protein SIID45300_01550 [Candidatus Magnetaquicoccaceae bacterium FCR-1]|uniref:Uncharacterized protein n=1 Tax=Candidatus Magnetaquiglobus chichijimensis TaxID=3141448 RepID=A0ABQ0C8M3_9PROT